MNGMNGMNGDEIGKLLGLMALADNRKPPEDEEGRKAMIAFWMSMVGDLPYADAAWAVQEHYRDTREWIMPADIRRRVRAARDRRLMLNPPPAPPRKALDDPAEYGRHLRESAKRIADGRPGLRAIGGTR